MDEFVEILDEQREPVYLLQDGNYSLVAAVRPTAVAGGGGTSSGWGSGSGSVIEDLACTPYGRPVSHRYQGTLASGSPLLLGMGHQGLFFDRFDFTPGQPPLELGAGVRGVYSNRNRSYSAILGRFFGRVARLGATAGSAART